MRLGRRKKAGEGLSNRQWIGIVVFTFLATFVAGLFLPDGANKVAGWFGKDQVPDSPLVRFLSFLVLLLVTVGIELVLWLRSQTRETLQDVSTIVERGIAVHGRDIAESAALRSLLPHQAATTEAAAEAGRLVKVFGDLLADMPPDLVAGYSIVLHDLLADVAAELETVGSSGFEVDVGRHLDIARALAAGASSFTQINRRAYDVSREWTEVWRGLVVEFGARRWPAARPEYIVLMAADELASNEAKIRGMHAYFEDAGWSMRCCELEAVKDTFAGRLPTDADAIDIYSDVAAKLLWLPAGTGFSGAIQVRIQLARLVVQTRLREFVREVQRSAQPPRWSQPLDGDRFRSGYALRPPRPQR